MENDVVIAQIQGGISGTVSIYGVSGYSGYATEAKQDDILSALGTMYLNELAIQGNTGNIDTYTSYINSKMDQLLVYTSGYSGYSGYVSVNGFSGTIGIENKLDNVIANTNAISGYSGYTQITDGTHDLNVANSGDSVGTGIGSLGIRNSTSKHLYIPVALSTDSDADAGSSFVPVKIYNRVGGVNYSMPPGDDPARPIYTSGTFTGTVSGTVNAGTGWDTSGIATETTLYAINAKLVSGTDIGDVTINNGSGAAAVPIQDGGNSITVDGTTTANQGTAAASAAGWPVKPTDGTTDGLFLKTSKALIVGFNPSYFANNTDHGTVTADYSQDVGTTFTVPAGTTKYITGVTLMVYTDPTAEVAIAPIPVVCRLQSPTGTVIAYLQGSIPGNCCWTFPTPFKVAAGDTHRTIVQLGGGTDLGILTTQFGYSEAV